MMSYLVVCSVALIASGLTFFSGFGLGTLLLPAFALFFAIEKAVALTAVVHFLNGLFKLFLVRHHVDRATVVRFGLAAIVGALVGAWTLLWLSVAPSVVDYTLFGRAFSILPAKLMVGLLLLFFSAAELTAPFQHVAFPARYLAMGGLLSGFFGGLAGMQGALRSAFLIKAGLSKESFVATGAAIAFLVDLTRLGVYAALLARQRWEVEPALLAAAVSAAFVGAAVGNRYLPKITLRGIQRTVAALLFVVALGLISGVL